MPFGLTPRQHDKIVARDWAARWALKREQEKEGALCPNNYDDAVRGFYGR